MYGTHTLPMICMTRYSFGRNWIARGATYIFTDGRIPYLYFSCNIRNNQLELKRIELLALLC